MKRIIIISLLLLSVNVISFANNAADEATAAYNKGDFSKAIELLEKEKDSQKAKGVESADLYYNLGNAYFRNNDIAKALLNYERALLLNPGDKDIKHNIEYVSSLTEDKILVADTFFLADWLEALQHCLSANAWATTAIVSFLLLIGCLFLYFFGKNINIKKASFYAGIFLIAVIIFSNVFAFRQKDEIKHRTTAIIMSGAVNVKSSPDINSKDLFILHSGTKVKINKEDRRWLEIEITDGNVGWVQRDALEII